MKRILTSLVLVASVYSFAQVSISGGADDTPQATLDVKAISGKANGILVPRVSKADADDMPNPDNASAIEESTLIYITGDVSTAGTKYATEVKTNGFYYFKGGKWVKLGGESATKSVNLNGITGKTQKLPSPVLAADIEPDTFAVIVTGTTHAKISLPNPASFPGRVLAVNNQSGSILSFTGEYQPANTNSVESGDGFFLIAFGDKWYLIGGSGA